MCVFLYIIRNTKYTDNNKNNLQKCNSQSTLRCRYVYYIIAKWIRNMLYVFNVEEEWEREVSL
jgi:hypothetical protein